ncbi:MAG: nucleoside phosphorylase [Anaerolineales bacterium]|nr:nucleoside phosphorylase [Anaerolineales bacterium]
MSDRYSPPLLRHKKFEQPSVFTPENLLREARRQKSLAQGSVPPVCVLDPDGDILRYLLANRQAQLNPSWACYHTELYDFYQEGLEFGLVGRAVGASFAVLVAEELFASGCQLLISVTSAGQILPLRKPPYFVLIERALRDEGTSYHYLPSSDYASIDQTLLKTLEGAFAQLAVRVDQGASWTTDAPFRETPTAIEYCRAERILAVEMEAAALYAFAQARQKPVICFAHITNQMGRIEGDFEKGVADGSQGSLQIIIKAARQWFIKRR